MLGLYNVYLEAGKFKSALESTTYAEDLSLSQLDVLSKDIFRDGFNRDMFFGLPEAQRASVLRHLNDTRETNIDAFKNLEITRKMFRRVLPADVEAESSRTEQDYRNAVKQLGLGRNEDKWSRLLSDIASKVGVGENSSSEAKQRFVDFTSKILSAGRDVTAQTILKEGASLGVTKDASQDLMALISQASSGDLKDTFGLMRKLLPSNTANYINATIDRARSISDAQINGQNFNFQMMGPWVDKEQREMMLENPEIKKVLSSSWGPDFEKNKDKIMDKIGQTASISRELGLDEHNTPTRIFESMARGISELVRIQREVERKMA